MVNRQYLAEVQVQAERDSDLNYEKFLNWAVCDREELLRVMILNAYITS